MNAYEYRQLLQKKQKTSKYHAKPTTINGIRYDSKKEANRAAQLQHMEKIGIIKNLQRQVPFVLQEPFVNNMKQKIRAITYIADFVYTDSEGKRIVEDVKGMKTDIYKIKKKLFEKKFPEFYFREC